MRWWVRSLKSFRTRSAGFGIRDERCRIVEELEQEAVRRTRAIYDALVAGRTPVDGDEEQEGPLTLASRGEVATTGPTGM